MGIILTAVVTVNIGTSRASALLQARNDLLPETQIAQNYVASKLRQASYVFTDGTSFTLNSTSATTLDPSGSSLWTVGSDPVVAFILPPKTVTTGQCAAAVTVAAKDTYCYAFYAFYGTKRNNLTNNTTGIENPGVDAANDNTSWVLMEYRNYYATGTAGSYTSVAAAVAAIPTSTTVVGHLVMDYLKPTTESGTDVLFDSPASSSVVAQTPGSTSVIVNLAAYRTVAGQALNLPATGRYSMTIFPRNLGSTQANN